MHVANEQDLAFREIGRLTIALLSTETGETNNV